MAGRVQGADGQAADGKHLVVGEQMVELAAITGEFFACVEQATEHLLHRGDVFADAEFAAQGQLQVGRCR